MYQSCLSLRKCVSVNDAQLDYALPKTELRPQIKLFQSLRQLDLTEDKGSKKCRCLEEKVGCGKILKYREFFSKIPKAKKQFNAVIYSDNCKAKLFTYLR